MNSADPEHDVFDDDRDDDPDAVSYNLVGHIHPSDRYHSQRYATSVRTSRRPSILFFPRLSLASFPRGVHLARILYCESYLGDANAERRVKRGLRGGRLTKNVRRCAVSTRAGKPGRAASRNVDRRRADRKTFIFASHSQRVGNTTNKQTKGIINHH